MTDRKLAWLVFLSVAVIVFAALCIFLTTGEMQAATNKRSVGQKDRCRGIEFVSGERVSVKKDGSLVLELDPFNQEGQEQHFSISLKNNNNMRAHICVVVELNEEYFDANYTERFSIKPGDTAVFSIDLILIKMPEEKTSAIFNVQLKAEYYGA